MIKFVLAFSILLLSVSAGAAQVEFSDAESPYITLERAFNVSRPIESDDIPTTEQTYTRTKNLKVVDRLIDPNLSLFEFHKTGILGFVRFVQRIVIPAVPARGPLFPGSPETVQWKDFYFYCKAECKSDTDLLRPEGIMRTDAQETIIEWKLRKDIWRIYGKSLIGKTISNNQIVYLYGWLE